MRTGGGFPRRGGPRVGRHRNRLLLIAAIAVALASGGIWWGTQSPDAGPPSGVGGPGLPEADAPARLSRADLADLAASVSATVTAGEPRPVLDSTTRLRMQLGPAFAVARHGGRWLGSGWAERPTELEGVTAAVSEAFAATDPAQQPRIDSVELCLSHSYRDIPPGQERDGLLTDVHMGVHGLELHHGANSARYSPTLMLANNWDFQDAMERFAAAYDVAPADLRSAAVRVRVFGCDQVLISLGERPRAAVMLRGNTLVPMEDVRRVKVARLGALMGDWLAAQVHKTGRMTYAYWPSRGEESPENNMIRQWMATVALDRLAAHRGADRAIYRLAERNIRYNLDKFYTREGSLGLIVEPSDGDVKLGAVALAALAIMEHPRRQEFALQEAALRRTVNRLWQEDGSFRTFFRPADRVDNQNFYPGEALLLWANRYRETRDPALLERFMRSFRYYRRWHLDEANRNPAFVPWHTQAYAAVWRVTRDRRLLEFVFEMNDWLLTMQQWEGAVYPDLRGRFYDPERPEYGSPHASSTGVYLEGLVEALRLARQVGDVDRSESYLRAIRRGLRNVMQLQFTDTIDLYYVDDREAAHGGIRTEVYDNVIRVDNVQHNLMAVLAALGAWPSHR